MAFLVILMLMVGGTAVYLHTNPLRPAHLPIFLFSFSIVFFLSRFNGLVTIRLGQYPLVGIHLYLLGLLLFLGLVLALTNRPLSRAMAAPLPYLMFYAVFSVVSGAYNAGVTGVLAALQVLVITLTPALLAWVLMELARGEMLQPSDLRKLYILPLGVVTPLILMVSALMPGLFSGLLGWGLSTNFGGDEGFMRGWSPMGSTILTGALVVIAFGYALHEAVVNRSKLHTVVAALASASILFTASRAVMVIFVIFNLIYWPMVGKKKAFVRVASLPALMVAAILGWSLVTGAVSFERFLVLNDQSTEQRASSALAAAGLAGENILLGQGPGQIYSEIRTLWLSNPGRQVLLKEKVIGRRESAMEPHNLYLYLMAEHGGLATIAFVLAMFGGLGVVWRWRPAADSAQRSERAVFIGLWVGLGFIFLTASWPLLNPQFSVFFWLFVFSGLYTVEAPKGEGRP